MLEPPTVIEVVAVPTIVTAVGVTVMLEPPTVIAAEAEALTVDVVQFTVDVVQVVVAVKHVTLTVFPGAITATSSTALNVIFPVLSIVAVVPEA